MATNITITEIPTSDSPKNRIITIASNDNITTMERRTGSSGEKTMIKFRLFNYSINYNGTTYVDSQTTIEVKECTVNLNSDKYNCPGGVKLVLYGKGVPDLNDPFVDIYLSFVKPRKK